MTRQRKTKLCPCGMVGVGGKWDFWIIYHLLDGTKRFGELQRLIPRASRQMLTMQLRELEQMGVVRRQDYGQVPPKVEYSLSELARSLEPVLRRVYAWGKWYGGQAGLEDDWLVRLGGKWMFWIIYHLLDGTKRFGELQRLIPRASRQMLSMHLRELEQMGIVCRRVSAQIPPKVEYSLSELARRSETVFYQMYAWGRWYCDQVGLEFDWPVDDEANIGDTFASAKSGSGHRETRQRARTISFGFQPALLNTLQESRLF